VVLVEQGVLELNWTWLPTFIGMDAAARKDMRDATKQFEGKEISEQVLDEAHSVVCDFLVARYPAISGLRQYLDGLKFVGLEQ
jgi:hypothetical protein